MDNLEERQVEMWNNLENMEDSKWNSEMISKIQKKIVKWNGKYERKASWLVKRYEKHGRKMWNGMENMKERQLISEKIWKIWKKLWNDMENI